MFDFTLKEFVRDMLIVGSCFAAMGLVVVAILSVRFKRYGGDSRKRYPKKEYQNPIVHYVFLILGLFLSVMGYFKKEWQKPIVHYGFLTLGLFFSVYASRLVVVRMTLALCYAFVIARIFLRSDPR